MYIHVMSSLCGYFQIPTLIYLFPSDTKSSLAETKKCKSCQADLTSVAKAARKEWQVSGDSSRGRSLKMEHIYKQITCEVEKDGS